MILSQTFADDITEWKFCQVQYQSTVALVSRGRRRRKSGIRSRRGRESRIISRMKVRKRAGAVISYMMYIEAVHITSWCIQNSPKVNILCVQNSRPTCRKHTFNFSNIQTLTLIDRLYYKPHEKNAW